MRTAAKGRKRKYVDGVARLKIGDVSGLLNQALITGAPAAGRWFPSRLDDRFAPAVDHSGRAGFSVAVTEFGEVRYCFQYSTGVQRRRRHTVVGSVRAFPEHCAFGGRRWFFVCPETRAHVRTLYFSKSRSRGERFVSMKAAGLSYRSQSADKVERQARKALRIASGLPDGVDVKPARMHQKTFTRKVQALKAIVAAVGT